MKKLTINNHEHEYIKSTSGGYECVLCGLLESTIKNYQDLKEVFDWDKEFDINFNFIFKSENAIVYASRENIKAWIGRALRKVYLEGLEKGRQEVLQKYDEAFKTIVERKSKK